MEFIELTRELEFTTQALYIPLVTFINKFCLFKYNFKNMHFNIAVKVADLIKYRYRTK